MNEVKIGLVGCGKQAPKHISGLKKIPGVELVLSDIQADLARDLAAKEGIAWVENMDDIFADPGIVATAICTPTRTHVGLIKNAIEAGKHVFCEKPLSDSIEEARNLQRALAGSDRIVMLGYVYRFVPILVEAHRLFSLQRLNGESLTMGRPLSAFFRLGGRGSHQTWKHQKATGGGAINEMLVHMIDLANWYFGPIEEIEVISHDIRCPERVIQGRKMEADAEDFILIRCIGACGVEIFCQADLITPAFTQYVEIQSENGSFMGSIQADMPSYIFLKEARGGYDAGRTELRFGQRNLFDIQIMTFVQSVLQNRLPDRNTVEDSLQLMWLTEKIRKQVAEHE